MIGYVKIYKPELKVINYELYRAVYCSLCRQMGKTYGPFARFALNYDFTFLSLVRLSVSEGCPGYKKARCVFNPLLKCHNIKENSDHLSYCADAAMIMSYYKVKDNLKDKGVGSKIKAALVYPLFALAYKKARKRRPNVDGYVRNYISAQDRLESEGCINADAAAEPTAVLLGRIFEDTDTTEKNKRVLSRVGYCLGKWIYLLDAADDLESDINSGNYNVLTLKYGIEKGDLQRIKEVKGDITSTLNICRAEASASARLLDTKRYADIIENILCLGLKYVQNQVISGTKTTGRNEYVLSDE